jgi:preprotein translocase subunit SecD
MLQHHASDGSDSCLTINCGSFVRRRVVGCRTAWASPFGAQPKSEKLGCPSFHEVHATITGKDALQAQVPVGFKVYASDVDHDEPLLLREIPIVTGDEVADAGADIDYRTNEQVVAFRFNAAAKRKFADFTTRNIGHSFAIVLDNRAISVLLIREPITLGVGQISGRFTVGQAEQLAAKLKSGTCRRAR